MSRAILILPPIARALRLIAEKIAVQPGSSVDTEFEFNLIDPGKAELTVSFKTVSPPPTD